MHVVDVRLNGILTHSAEVGAEQLDAEFVATLKHGPKLQSVSFDRDNVSDALLQELLSTSLPIM